MSPPVATSSTARTPTPAWRHRITRAAEAAPDRLFVIRDAPARRHPAGDLAAEVDEVLEQRHHLL
jgi:hypothetical protein